MASSENHAASEREEGGGSPAAREEGGAELAEAAAPTVKARYCAVYDCTNNHKSHSDLAYFGFPADKARIKQWVEKIRRPDILLPDGRVSSYYRVCETHFLPRQINTNKQRRRLMKRAVPSLRLPHPGSYVKIFESPTQQQVLPGRRVQTSPSPQSPEQVKGKTLKRSTIEVFQYVDEPKLTKKRRKLVFRPPPLTAAPPTLGGFFTDCDSHLSPNTTEFFKLATRLQTGQNSLNKCLKLFHSSPQAYRLLQASLGLPAASMLHRHCARHLPDFDTALDLLKARVDRMTQIETHCTLSVDFIDTRPNLYYNITFDRIVGLHEVDGVQSPWVAKRAVTVVARGLLANWTQPVALCYLARDDDALNKWIDKIIRHLVRIGLKVHALVCDPAAPLRARVVSTDQPFFDVDNTKIYVMVDPPRLIKMLYCDFMAYDFFFEKKTARWHDLVQYKKIEGNKTLTLTPGLTDACMNPATVSRMRPTRVARILSSGLAAALASRIDQGLLAQDACATVNLILKVNKLYDLLNSTTIKGNYLKKGLTQDKNQIEFLAYMKSFFKFLKFKHSFGCFGPGSSKAATREISENWQVTIGAVLALREELQPLRPYLLTRHLHLVDSVGESARRAAGGHEPSCQQIFVAFKKQFLHEMLQPPGRDRRVDLNSLLTQIVSDASAGTEPIEVDDEMRVQANDYRRLRVPNRRSLAATATAKHLLRAASRVHGDCDLAANYLRAPPQPDFLRLVSNLDEALTSALGEGASARCLLRDLLLDVHVLDCALPCECFPLGYVKRLFFRLRLYRLLRQNQNGLKTAEGITKLIL